MEINWIIIEDEDVKAERLIEDLDSLGQSLFSVLLTQIPDDSLPFPLLNKFGYKLIEGAGSNEQNIEKVVEVIASKCRPDSFNILCLDMELKGITDTPSFKYTYVRGILKRVSFNVLLNISVNVAPAQVEQLLEQEFLTWNGLSRDIEQRRNILRSIIKKYDLSVKRDLIELISIDCHDTDFQAPVFEWLYKFNGYKTLDRFLARWGQLLTEQRKATIFSESLKEAKYGNFTVGLVMMLLLRMENSNNANNDQRPIEAMINNITRSPDVVEIFKKSIIQLRQSKANISTAPLEFESRTSLPDFAETLYKMFCLISYHVDNNKLLISSVSIDPNDKVIFIVFEELGTDQICEAVVSNIQEHTEETSDSGQTQLTYKIPNDKRKLSMSILKVILDSLACHSTYTFIGSPFTFLHVPGDKNKLSLKIKYQ